MLSFMANNGHSNGNGAPQVPTGSRRITVTPANAPTTNEKAELTINSPEALAALQQKEMSARQDNKVNLLKKALDGYSSLTANYGPTDFVRGAAFNFLLDGPKDIDAECGYPPWLMPQQYNYMYDREAIAKRVVDCLPEETWAMDPEIWEDDDPDKETPFEETWQAIESQHNCFSMMQRADVLSGIGQFGIILIGIDDGKDLREPVEGIFDDGSVDPQVEHKLLYLRVFSEVVVFVKVREIDITSPRYSQPKIYTIQFRDYPNWGVQAGEIIARDVHWTRVIHLADNRKESEVYGVPRMQPVYNRLYDLRKIYSSSGEGYWKGAFPGLAFEVNPEVAAQGVELDVKSIREEMERFQNGLQRYLALTGVTTKSLPVQMVEPGSSVECHLRAIAICLGIPTRILWGSEEAVLAGNQDSRAWNKRLGKRQTKYVNPLIIRPFINRLIGMGVLPPPKDGMVKTEEGTFIITGGYQIEWPDLNAPTDMDKAQVAAAETSAMASYVQGGVSQLMAPREYLTHVMGYSVEEADAILEASMEFAGDEEEPLSAASQAAQEQEAAEQQHAQAMEMQDAKGAEGENISPERNSAGPGLEVDWVDLDSAGPGLEVNGDNFTILNNPKPHQLRRMWSEHKKELGPKESEIVRGLIDPKTGEHFWAKTADATHSDIQMRVDPMARRDFHHVMMMKDGSLSPGWASVGDDPTPPVTETIKKLGLTYDGPVENAASDEDDHYSKVDLPYHTPEMMESPTHMGLKEKTGKGKAFPFIRADEDSMHGVLANGRFKNQFETGTSNGAEDPEFRRDSEEYVFGTPHNHSGDKRPIYGYLHGNENGRHLEPDEKHEESHYGEVRVRLKDSIRPRTTFTLGDSLLDMPHGMKAAALNRPHVDTLNKSALRKRAEDPGRSIHDLTNQYTEAQYHGGVGVKDIHSIYLPKDHENGHLHKTIVQAGIPVHFDEKE